MSAEHDPLRGTGLPASFTTPGSASFTEFLAAQAPQLLPGARLGGHAGSALTLPVPHGTTIIALTFAGGAVMAGDRRATMGSMVAQRDIEKVFPADGRSCVGIAGTAGIAVELVRLFQVELEHYEKIEGIPLSLEGKANRLSTLLRANLGLAMQGLAAIPLFAGYDDERARGRIFSYDVTGGRYEELDYHSVGSGSVFARGSLKKLFSQDLSEASAITVALEALYDAADDDSATGLPDVSRGIYPVVAVVDADGFRRIAETDVERAVRTVIARRTERPDGPRATVPEAGER